MSYESIISEIVVESLHDGSVIRQGADTFELENVRLLPPKVSVGTQSLFRRLGESDFNLVPDKQGPVTRLFERNVLEGKRKPVSLPDEMTPFHRAVVFQMPIDY